MVSRYPNLRWDTSFPVVIEKFNAFKGQGTNTGPLADNEHRKSVKKRIGKPGGYLAPFALYAMARGEFYGVVILPNYRYYIHADISLIAEDLFYLIDKPMSDDRGAYIQLIITADRSLHAKVRTQSRVHFFVMQPHLDTWEQYYKDPTNPRNW